MIMCLRNKFQVSSITLTRFTQGGGILLPPAPPPQNAQKEPLKSPPPKLRLRLSKSIFPTIIF